MRRWPLIAELETGIWFDLDSIQLAEDHPEGEPPYLSLFNSPKGYGARLVGAQRTAALSWLRRYPTIEEVVSRRNRAMDFAQHFTVHAAHPSRMGFSTWCGSMGKFFGEFENVTCPECLDQMRKGGYRAQPAGGL